MRVRCIAPLPTPEQAERLKGQYFPGQQVFNVEPGEEYVVFGMYFIDGIPWINIEGSWYLLPVPLCLFEIIDGRLSRQWVATVRETGDLALWPPSFHQEYYFDDLIEQVPDVVADFARVRAAIYAEVEAPD